MRKNKSGKKQEEKRNGNTITLAKLEWNLE